MLFDSTLGNYHIIFTSHKGLSFQTFYYNQ